jgi:valyl-tRNA synthetase
MKGNPALWVPGTDHAGIATQNVVEKMLAKENKTRFDLGREKFIAEVWQWKEKYGHIIIDQLKKMGASCDWTRQRFTMDEGYSKAVLKAFEHYYSKGWIYRGERVINWCPRCGTAISDIEIELKEKNGKLWFIKYPIVDSNESITVATTRPETMLGDTAVAVNSKDKRYINFIGKKVMLPIANREISIIADDTIDIEFGTGAVKITPAHDFDDFEMAEKHKLDSIKIIDEKGEMTSAAGADFVGLDRFKARKKVLELLESKGLLEKTEDYQITVPLCARCGTLVEPLLSKQWFLKMSELAAPAIRVVEEGKIKFHPESWKKVYLDWMNNLKDWCISRQIWWGHRIPVWESKSGDVYVGTNPPDGYKQSEDVLDTWFSSALWPFATLGWPDENATDLKKYYPTSTLSTARDIIYLWVARMIFSGLEFTGEIPFTDVYIHPTVFNKEGKRMSKSLGTGIDPLELVEKYGADSVRFGLAYQNTGIQDMKFSEDSILAGRNFINKVWNASRFTLMNLEGSDVSISNNEPVAKTEEDKKILDRLADVKKIVSKDIEKYKFGQAAHEIYDFFWHDFCDVYLEVGKEQIKEDSLSQNTKEILLFVLASSIKILHPFIPFATEEIWSKLPGEKDMLIVTKW